MTEDWLGFGDPAEQQAARGPALMIPAKMGPRELRVAEEMHRRDDAPAANRLIFIDEDETGKEIWARPALGDEVDEGKRWQKIMKWPRIPTIEEAQAAKEFEIARRLAKWWGALRAARELDERLGFECLDEKPARGGKA